MGDISSPYTCTRCGEPQVRPGICSFCQDKRPLSDAEIAAQKDARERTADLIISSLTRKTLLDNEMRIIIRKNRTRVTPPFVIADFGPDGVKEKK